MSKSFPQYLLPEFMIEKLFGSTAAPLLAGLKTQLKNTKAPPDFSGGAF
jgi:hypothetical protein